MSRRRVVGLTGSADMNKADRRRGVLGGMGSRQGSGVHVCEVGSRESQIKGRGGMG